MDTNAINSENQSNAGQSLSADQLRIAAIFAKMDDRHQREVMVFVTSIAQAFPRRATPTLRLVVGGAA